jgi:hypothetical protein
VTTKDAIQKMTDAYNLLHPKAQISAADELILVQQNPELLTAFLNQQASLSATADWLQRQADKWANLSGAALAAAKVAANAAGQIQAAQTLAAASSKRQGAQHGALVNAPMSGEDWTLHGIEAIIPKDRAQPWLWSAMVDTLAGRMPQLPKQGSEIAALTTTARPASSSAGALASGGGPITINQTYHATGSSMADVQTIVRQGNRDLMLALRSH